MKTLPVGEFKSHFSEVLESVKNGEEIAISYGRRKEKIAVIIPYTTYSKNTTRNLGILEKKAAFKVSDDFKMTDNEFLNS